MPLVFHPKEKGNAYRNAYKVLETAICFYEFSPQESNSASGDPNIFSDNNDISFILIAAIEKGEQIIFDAETMY